MNEKKEQKKGQKGQKGTKKTKKKSLKRPKKSMKDAVKEPPIKIKVTQKEIPEEVNTIIVAKKSSKYPVDGQERVNVRTPTFYEKLKEKGMGLKMSLNSSEAASTATPNIKQSPYPFGYSGCKFCCLYKIRWFCI